MNLRFGRRLSGVLATVLLALGLLAGARIASALHGRLERSGQTPPAAAPLGRFAEGDLLARVRLPRLRGGFEVFEGVEATTLLRGGGHVPGTALPGEGGDRPCVIALARDSGVQLAALRLADSIEMKTPFGLRRYAVVARRVVPAGAARFEEARRGRVTFVTPYPADTMGPAPSRLAVVVEEQETDRPAASGGSDLRGFSFLRESRDWLGERSAAPLRTSQLLDELRDAIDRAHL